MSLNIIETSRGFEITFAFNPSIHKAVKKITGRRFDPMGRMWVAPLSSRDEVMAFAKRWALKKDTRPEYYEDIPPLPDLTIDINLRRDLFPFQRNGVAYGLEKKRLIIGDEPGLGKTAQAIAIITAAQAFPCLVICPASLKYNWQREWQQWTGTAGALIMSDKIKSTWGEFIRVGAGKIFITNYESLKKYFVTGINKPDDVPLRLNHIKFHEGIGLFKSVIIDESHRAKEMKTQHTKFTKGITHGKEWILALTGTPVVNKPKDLLSQLGIIGQAENFGNYKGFIERYCDGYDGASNLKELNWKLNKHCFYRRGKKEVLKDLPDKMRQIVLCDISTRTEYAAAVADLESYLKNYKNATDEKVAAALRGEVMVKIQHLKDISARGKLNDVCEQIQDVLEQGEKLVVFTHLREVGSEILRRFPGALSIRGNNTNEERQQAVDKFQNDPTAQLIICSIKAAGVGLTLTASSRVAFVELPWHAADCDQCEDRCHRIGQHDSVQCTYFLGKDTIDEDIYKIIESKREISNTITGVTGNIETEVMDIMMGSLFNKKKTQEGSLL